jgi:hypothetical protein
MPTLYLVGKVDLAIWTCILRPSSCVPHPLSRSGDTLCLPSWLDEDDLDELLDCLGFQGDALNPCAVVLKWFLD